MKRKNKLTYEQAINKLDDVIDKYCEANERFNYLIELIERLEKV